MVVSARQAGLSVLTTLFSSVSIHTKSNYRIALPGRVVTEATVFYWTHIHSAVRLELTSRDWKKSRQRWQFSAVLQSEVDYKNQRGWREMKSPPLQSVQTLFLAKRLLDLNWRHMNVTHCWRSWRPTKKKKVFVDWINFHLGRICIKEVAAARAAAVQCPRLARDSQATVRDGGHIRRRADQDAAWRKDRILKHLCSEARLLNALWIKLPGYRDSNCVALYIQRVKSWCSSALQ